MSRRWRLPLLLVSALLFVFLYAPIGVVAFQSFNRASRGIEWRGFTTGWYHALFHNEMALHAMGMSLALAIISTAVSTALGALLALALSRGRFFGQRFVEWTLQSVIVIPDVVLAVALLMFYAVVRRGLSVVEPGLVTMALAHITFQIPFVTLVVRARLTGLDPSLAEAARDLGANGWQTFWCVTWPLMRPGVLAGGLLAFTLSLDDFVISFFTTGPGATTLPIFIYSSVKRGITPDINALSTLMVLVSMAATVSVLLLQRRNSNSQTSNSAI